jgi:hypothetical protein
VKTIVATEFIGNDSSRVFIKSKHNRSMSCNIINKNAKQMYASELQATIVIYGSGVPSLDRTLIFSAGI